MKLNQRIVAYETDRDNTRVGTMWASVEFTSITLHNATIGAVNKYSYLVHIRKQSPYAKTFQPYNTLEWNGQRLNIDTVSETRDGKYLRFVCTPV